MVRTLRYGILANIFLYICCGSLYVYAVAENVTIGGRSLIDIGREVDNPLLRLLGTVFIHLEDKYLSLKDENVKITDELCRLSRCSDWIEWSQCEASINGGQFGIKKRNRTCRSKNETCNGNSISEVEVESTICEKMCQHHIGYKNTYRGFCLKFYSTRKNRSDAEATCRRDSGHLVNVDTVQKVHDLEELLQENSKNDGGLWIDGIRSEKSSKWRYNVQPLDPSFTYWDEVQGEPDLRENELCKVFYFGAKSKVWRWHDAYCDKQNVFVCEKMRQ